MIDGIRITLTSLRVLKSFLNDTSREWSGREIGKETGIASGSLYPILNRLREADWLQDRWEDVDPREVGRPRRRFYRLTVEGESRARAMLEMLN